MKNLILVSFLFLSTVLFGQAKLTEGSKSYTVNKELAIALFDKLNDHRTKLNLGKFVWSESWYNSSLKANKILEQKNSWGHTDVNDLPSNFVTELIVGYSYVNTSSQKPTTKEIVDSCMSQWIHSYHHNWRIELPVMTDKQKKITKLRKFGSQEIPYNTDLCKYGAISCVVSNYEGYSVVKFILQLSQENDVIAKY